MSYRDLSIPKRRAFLGNQLRVVMRLVKDETILCAECGKSIRIFYAYRCRWCGFYFCPVCADTHFGPDISEWRLP